MRTLLCLEKLFEVVAIPGDVIELGVARGDTTFPMANLLGCYAKDKTLYACDTFSGLPYDDSIVTASMCKKGEINCGDKFLDILNIRKDRNIKCVVGLVEDTLPKSLGSATFCFAWVDMDLYQATSFAYRFLESRMAVGGIIGFHDYGFVRCPGIRRVVDGEVDYDKYAPIFNNYACFFIRRVK